MWMSHKATTQVAIKFNNCISRSEIRYNFTEEIVEERLDFRDIIYTFLYTFLSLVRV